MELIGLCVCLTIYFSLRYVFDYLNEQNARADFYKHGPAEEQDETDWWKRSDN